MTIDSGYADYLKADALFVTAIDATAASWPKGRQIRLISPFATRTAAIAEGARQAAFLGGPKVREKVVVAGRRRDLLGKVVALKGSRLGYSDAPIAALVIGYQERGGFTVLTVVRRLD